MSSFAALRARCARLLYPTIAAARRPRSNLTPVIEFLERRALLSGITATPATSSELDVNWTSSDSSHLELEEQGPTDSNFHLVADLGTPGAGAQGTVFRTNLFPDANYRYRLRIDSGAQTTYASADGQTASTIGNGGDPVELPAPTYFTASGADMSIAMNWEGQDPSFGVAFQVVSTDPLHLTPANNADPSFQTFIPQTDGNGHWSASYSEFESPYAYKVRIQFTKPTGNGGLVVSPWSDWSTATVTSAFGVPSAPQLSSTAISPGTVRVDWTVANALWPDVTLYRVVNNQLTGLTSFSINGSSGAGFADVPAGPAGSQIVGMLGAIGGYSAHSNFVPGDGSPATPAAPTGLSATPYLSQSGHGIRLLWDNSSNNESGFTITRTHGDEVTTFDAPEDTPGLDDTTATPGVPYTYDVVANGSGGASDSEPASVDKTLVLPTVNAVATQMGIEAGPATTFDISLSGGNVVREGDIQVHYHLEAGTASLDELQDDSGGYVTIGTDQSDATASIGIKDDTEAEGVQDFSLVVDADEQHYQFPLVEVAQATGPAATQPQAPAPKGRRDDNVAITSITVEAAAPNFQAHNLGPAQNTYHSFLFYAVVKLTGEHLDKVELRQDVFSKTSVWDSAGVQSTPDQALALARAADPNAPADLINTTDWKPDPQGGFGNWISVAPMVTDQINGTAQYTDTQGGSFPTDDLPMPNGGKISASLLASVERSYRISLRDGVTKHEFDPFTWSFTWTNAPNTWTNADDPALNPGEIYAAQAKNGGKGKLISTIPGIAALN